jgi:hypothetical protein
MCLCKRRESCKLLWYTGCLFFSSSSYVFVHRLDIIIIIIIYWNYAKNKKNEKLIQPFVTYSHSNRMFFLHELTKRFSYKTILLHLNFSLTNKKNFYNYNFKLQCEYRFTRFCFQTLFHSLLANEKSLK